MSHLAPGIAGLLDRRDRRTPGLLALADHDLIAAVGGSRADEAHRFLAEFDHRAARSAIDRAGVGAVCRHAADYPPGLLDLTDPPCVLYFVGAADRLGALKDGPVAAIVGTRRASAYALEVSRALGRGLSAAGVTVVSGLALGIDAAAHRGALDGGGHPIAVLAGGPDIPYPRANRQLYRQVRDRGAVVSEIVPGQRAYRWSFPARNRIMAGLADLTIVVEAAERSGSLITAAFAQDLNRDVGAVPGRVTARIAAGSNKLLRDGASVIRGPEDALDELYGVGGWTAIAEAGGDVSRPEPPAVEPSLRRVLDAVEAGAGVESIGRAAGASPGEVRAALGRLELLGLVARTGFGSYERVAAR